MNAMAKLCADNGIRIGRTRLFAWLRSKGILMTNNLPYQEYVEPVTEDEMDEEMEGEMRLE